MAKQTLCKTCGKQISKNATTCPHCGEVYKKYSIWQKIKYSILGILAFLFIIGYVSSPKINKLPSPKIEKASQKTIQVAKPTADEIKAQEELKSKALKAVKKNQKLEVLYGQVKMFYK